MKETNNHCYTGQNCGGFSVFNMAQYIPMVNETYKEQHEAFVSGNSGSTPLELYFVTLPWILCSFCVQILYATRICWTSKIFAFPFECVCLLTVQVFVLTVGADHAREYAAAMVFTAASLVVLGVILGTMRSRDGSGSENVLDSAMTLPDSNIHACITNVRGHLNMLVCLSILAVDFPIFPRRFAKTETYGYGLMDTGIGFFMLVNGLVAPEAKTKYRFSRGNAGALRKSLVSSVPLLVLGIVRVVAVKSLNYQEHVTEYGVHWNFFFSLAFAKIGCSLVFMLFPPICSGVIAVFLCVSYQILLQLGLDKVILNGFDGKDTRSNFLDANREGLASCVSFTCMYLTGIQTGYIVFRTGVTIRDWIKTSLKILCLWLSLATVACISHVYIAPASRRLVNVTYITWTSAFLILTFWKYIIMDVVTVILKHRLDDGKQHLSEPALLNKSLSYNFLLAFLLANLMTGTINMSMQTINASQDVSFAVIMSYMLTICFVCVICYGKKWQLKFG